MPKLKKAKNKNHSADLMPSSAEARLILSQRRDILAKPLFIENTIDLKHAMSYVRFRLNSDAQYGIPYLYTEEVMHHTAITPVPLAPQHIAGVINRRGLLITIVDLNQLFYKNPTPYNKDYIIVVHHDNITIGIAASHLESSYSYEAESLGSALSATAIVKPDYVLGLDKSVVTIINIETLIADIRSQGLKELNQL